MMPYVVQSCALVHRFFLSLVGDSPTSYTVALRRSPVELGAVASAIGDSVHVEPQVGISVGTIVREGHTGDRYKRIVGKVWVQPASCPTCPMTLDAGHAQITVGLAWWYRKYATEQSPQDRGAYEFSEQEARAKRAGLWRDSDLVPPLEWRHR